MLTTVSQILGAAQRLGYGVGAFGLVNLETGAAVLGAARACRSPVILLVGEEAESILSYRWWLAGLKELADDTPVPVAIALDHGSSLEACAQGVELGLSGVMYDGSRLPLAENLARSKEVVCLAHAAGVAVEAEIGHVPDSTTTPGNVHDWLSDPAEVAAFARLTGVDVLAVAVGTVHGLPLTTPCIDWSRLAEIRQRVHIPLALHGVSGTTPRDLERCVEMGVQKFNVYSDMVAEAARRLRPSLERQEDIVAWQQAIWSGFHDVAASYMELLGSAGRATGRLAD